VSSEPGDPFPRAGHDHAVCVREALDRAAALCAERGVKLTELRRRVLELVLDRHTPVGAYDILERLAEERGRVAPPTVYRALDFLVSQGLVHRVDSRNAFVGCVRADGTHRACFLLCRECGAVAELVDPDLDAAVEALARRAGFEIGRQVIEIEGRCAACRALEAAA
jgi:Fur family zinc uptake transcriptional regulator